jgi:glutathione peroxidase
MKALLLLVFLLVFFAPTFGWTALGGSAGDPYKIPLVSVDQRKTDLSVYRGKVLLIVNTASQCGYTPQYEGLEKISKKYREQGLVVLGFPSNDFGSQEPGSNPEIKHFCELKYHVDFPLFSKGPVTGEKIQPLYSWLLEHAPTHEAIEWNFEKFLIDRSGKIVGRFKSDVTPESDQLLKAIEKALSA